MAIFRLEAKIIARKNRGRSVVAASAYRAGKKLFDELKGKAADYLRRSKGVLETTILSPEGAPEWAKDSGKLWNGVERSEKRRDAQLAREFVLAMPKELDAKQQWSLALDWAKTELVDKGMVAELSLHHPKDGKNPHVHILCTLRKFDGDQFSAKKEREWNDVEVLMGWRKSWEAAANDALQKAGSDARIDHRSLKDQGIDRIPEPKIGVAATAMLKKGLVQDTERHKLVRLVRSLNFVKTFMNPTAKPKEVHQQGMGETWWERSLIFMAKAKETVQNTVLDTWHSLKNNFYRSPQPPTRGREGDLER